MLLSIGNTRTTVDALPRQLAWLGALLSFTDQSKAFQQRGGRAVRVEVPAVSLLEKDRLTGKHTFPAGLSAHVVSEAKKAGVSVAFADARTRPVEPDLSVETAWLRPYQREAAETAVAKTKGIIKLPTGTGKTEIAVAISMLLPGARVLMITPEKDLLHNAARRFEKRTGDTAGRIGDGIFRLGDFTAATFQTLAAGLRKGDPKLRKYMQTVHAMIIDEVHQLPADSFYSAAQAIPAYWRIGMSGTPLARGDRKGLFSVAACGSIIYQQSPDYFIERGWMSRPKIKLVKCVQGGDAANWQKSHAQFIVKSNQRNKLLTRMVRACAKPALLFVRQKKHGREMLDRLRAAGLRAEFVWGESSMAERDLAIKKLEWGDLDVIVCSKVFVTGTDIPDLAGMVNAMGGKSTIETLQRLGRGTRVTKTKTEFELWDVLDVAESPVNTSGNRWSHRHSLERKNVYLAQGYEVIIHDDVL